MESGGGGGLLAASGWSERRQGQGRPVGSSDEDRSEAEALDAVEHRLIIVGHEAMPGSVVVVPPRGRGAGVSGSRSSPV